MKKNLAIMLGGALLLAIGCSEKNVSAMAPQRTNSADRNPGGATSAGGQQRIEREVLHELTMLPYYDVFDNLSFQVNGSTVTLMGQVTRPTLKSDAENVVKRIEGVDKLVNNIE